MKIPIFSWVIKWVPFPECSKCHFSQFWALFSFKYWNILAQHVHFMPQSNRKCFMLDFCHQHSAVSTCKLWNPVNIILTVITFGWSLQPQSSVWTSMSVHVCTVHWGYFLFSLYKTKVLWCNMMTEFLLKFWSIIGAFLALIVKRYWAGQARLPSQFNRYRITLFSPLRVKWIFM